MKPCKKLISIHKLLCLPFFKSSFSLEQKRFLIIFLKDNFLKKPLLFNFFECCKLSLFLVLFFPIKLFLPLKLIFQNHILSNKFIQYKLLYGQFLKFYSNFQKINFYQTNYIFLIHDG